MRNAVLLAFCLFFISKAAYNQCNTTYNIALGKPATASSLENAGFPAANAFDGNTTATRWSSAFSDPQFIYVDLGSPYALCQVVIYWETALGKNFTIDISNDAVTWTTVQTVTNNASFTNTFSITGTGRYVRMNGTARGTGYGYSIYEMQVYSTAATPVCPVTDIALGKTATASSLESAAYPASNATDASATTRWSSVFSDPQYIYVDLGAIYNLCSVKLSWETALGKNFTIDASNDLTTWTNLSTITNNVSFTNTISVSGSGRYVRMYGTVRGTGYGYSLYDFSVFGSALLPVTLTNFKAYKETDQSVTLKWQTEQEENNKLFEIDRSTDAKTFEPIGEVAGVGNSSTVQNYTFTDHHPLAGINYYKLRQVDVDQRYIYSSIVSVDLSGSSRSSLEVFPNPVSNLLTVRAADGELLNDVRIYSQNGSQIDMKQSIASAIYSCSLQNLKPGLYFVQVSTNKANETFRILKN